MRSLKLSEWANVAEIIASVVIVASLAYVGLEINQNTRAVQTDSYQNVLAMLSDLEQILVTDEEFHRVFLTAESTPSDLSEEEWSRFTHYNLAKMGIWEYLYLGRQDGTITDTVWSAFDPYFRGIICMSGNRRFFEEQQTAHATLFFAYLEDDVFPNCSSQ